MIQIFRNWLTRPATPAEYARALSMAGHAAHKARVAATAAIMREQANRGQIARLAPRDEVVAGARDERRARV